MNTPVIISIISILIAIISLHLSIKAFGFLKKTRTNDKRPLFEYSNSFGGYHNIEERIPIIHLELKNSGGKAIVYKIEEKTGNKIICLQFNKTIDNNELLELQINSSKKIKHEEFIYDIEIFIKDVDNKIYLQTIKGRNIYPTISTSKEITKEK